MHLFSTCKFPCPRTCMCIYMQVKHIFCLIVVFLLHAWMCDYMLAHVYFSSNLKHVWRKFFYIWTNTNVPLRLLPSLDQPTVITDYQAEQAGTPSQWAQQRGPAAGWRKWPYMGTPLDLWPEVHLHGSPEPLNYSNLTLWTHRLRLLYGFWLCKRIL